MENPFYDLAEILICDPVVSNRAATRSALYSLGCRHIEMVSDLRDFYEALKQRPPDIALCEAQAGEADVCRVIQDLRQGKSSNPFVVIIVTAWAMNTTLASEIAKCGADGLILRPFSTGLLDQRIQAHVWRRKKFIVTTDYVGPERRAKGTRDCNIVSFDAPNSLKTKAECRSSSDDASRQFAGELQEGRARVAAERMRFADFQVSN